MSCDSSLSPNWISPPQLHPTDVRIEEFLYEKLEKKVPTRVNNHELLGQSMIDSGNEFGPGTAYGNQNPVKHMFEAAANQFKPSYISMA